METVGERIKRFRMLRKLTQAKVADTAGINVALLQHYEYGTRNPKAAQIDKIARALKVNPYFLREDNSDKPAYMLATLYNWVKEFGDIEFQEHDGKTMISFPNNDNTAAIRKLLNYMYNAKMESRSIEEFTNSLLEHGYQLSRKH